VKIGLWNDDHNFPNLATMKLSAWHKAQGDKVEILNHLNTYDLVYCSKVFDFTPDAEDAAAIRADKIIRAGTGYHDYKTVLPPKIEHVYPDYNIYPQYKQAYGFLTRGCPRNCGFCCVTKKEGCCSRQVSDLKDFWSGQSEIKLCDPNLLACKDSERVLKQIIASGSWVDITQGFDIRLIGSENISIINQLKIKSIHFAWDNPRDDLYSKFKFYAEHNTLSKHRKPSTYVLTNYWSTTEQDLERVYKLRELGIDPYIMIYDKAHAPQKVRWLQRWVNNKKVFRECERFEEYDPKRA
jgi:hypothetical protein